MTIKKIFRPGNKRFLKDERGAVAIIMSLSAVSAILAGGVAIDYLKVSSDRTRGLQALDSALLAATVSYQKYNNVSKARQTAVSYLEANWKQRGEYTLSMNFDPKEISGTLSSSTNLSFMTLVGKRVSSWEAESSVSYTLQPKIEYSLVVDISSSMQSGGHMGTLRQALLDFSKLVYGGRKKDDVVVSLVPFANAVRFPSSMSTWASKKKKANPFNGCFFDEDISRQASLSTSGVGQYLPTPDFTLISNQGKTQIYCPKSNTQVRFFMTDGNTLDAATQQLQVYQGTNTASGLSWGWRILDPGWRNTIGQSVAFPRSYSSKHRKTLVLFTDGLPYERPWEDRKVPPAEKSIIKQRERSDFSRVCTAIKDSRNSVKVIVVAYGDAMTSSEKRILRDCASGLENYYEADKANLSDVFREIGGEAVKIAITR